MKLSFYGAAQEVTGSNYLLEAGDIKILVDCGIFQGSKFSENKNYNPFPYNPADIDYVFLTHAHLDHCGRVPRLYKEGFRGKVFCTKATKDFGNVMLEDSQHVLANEASEGGYPPLYTHFDVEQVLTLFEGVDYNHTTKISDKLSFTFKDAGHILGSGILKLKIDGKKITFSGDLGNPPVPLLHATEQIKDADYLIIESTYGDRIHEDSKERLLLLQSAIYETVKNKGVLMIPAFALERTQELLYELNQLIENKDVPPVPVFVDSPLAIKATDIFKMHEELFNKEAHDLIASGDDVFNFPGLKMTRSSRESKQINNVRPPKIILAGSGMCVGGRIGFHLQRYLPDWRSQLLIVGYQVRGTLGRKLLEGEKRVKIMGQDVEVKAKVRAIGAYSAHADKPKLLKLISGIEKKPKKIFVTHGEADQAQSLAKTITQDLGIESLVPEEGDSVEL